jgi:group II intron reverse transcriptase/maturase
MVLEAIYEGQFENCSHGFRPQRSCHTAIKQIGVTFCGVKWYVEGDIKGFFDNINHDIMIGILEERITDDRFIRLIRKFLNAGYIEDWVFGKTYSGTPQGGIISPILANIYLDRLDKYMTEYAAKFEKGLRKKKRTEYRHYQRKKGRATKELKSVTTQTEREAIIERVRKYDKLMLQTEPNDEMDSEYRRLRYVRYADDFLCGIIGSKEDTQVIKEDIKKFLSEKLKLELSDEKTLITHSETPANFLGFHIRNRKSDHTKRDSIGRLKRCYSKTVEIKIPQDAIKKKLLAYDVVQIKKHNEKEVWKPKARPEFNHNDDLEILERYNSEIRGLYNYFGIAKNCSKQMSNFGYIMEYSMYKTFAKKLSSSATKVIKKYSKEKDFIISYTDAKGRSKCRVFYNEGFKKKDSKDVKCDNIPNTNFLPYPSLIERLKAEQREVCGANGKTVMYQVRTLKTLTGKTEWEQMMLKMHHKTLAVCPACNAKIHGHEN